MKPPMLPDACLDHPRDLHSCARRISRALPNVGRASVRQDVQAAINKHPEATREQCERLNRVLIDFAM